MLPESPPGVTPTEDYDMLKYDCFEKLVSLV